MAVSIVRTAIHFLNSLDLAGAQASCCTKDIDFRIGEDSLASERVADDVVLNAIVTQHVTSGQHRVPEGVDVRLRDIVVEADTVAIDVPDKTALLQICSIAISMAFMNRSPATMPWKSSGNLCASTAAWRPPVEHPSQYEYLGDSP